jgi:hypothetical protein
MKKLEDYTNLELINDCKGEFINPVAFRELQLRGLKVEYHNPSVDLFATRYQTTTKELYEKRRMLRGY